MSKAKHAAPAAKHAPAPAAHSQSEQASPSADRAQGLVAMGQYRYAASALKPEQDHHAARAIVQYGDDETTARAARHLYGKYPDNAALAKSDGHGRLQVALGALKPGAVTATVQYVGHGDTANGEPTLGGATASQLAANQRAIEKQLGPDVRGVECALVSCDSRPSLAGRFTSALGGSQGGARAVTSYAGNVDVSAEGRTVPVREGGLMFRAAIKGAAAAAAMGYELNKHRQQQTPPPTTLPLPRPVTAPSYGDRRAEEMRQKVKAKTDAFDPLAVAAGSFTGRGEAIQHVAQGQVPGMQSIQKGLDTATTLAEFSATGDVGELDKGKLAKAAATDAINNASFSLEGLTKAAKGTAAIMTVSDDKAKELQDTVAGLGEQMKDTAITSLSVGAGVGAALDGAAAAIPHPAAKIALKTASTVWKVAGAVHTAEEIGKIGEKQQDLISNELGKEAMAQIKQSNTSKRGPIMEAIMKSGLDK
ncbi:C80 family cysteine peptidase [Trinickia fusca]|uniref:Peptidase C80 domain-containing protein n=1 Tax=Trinickia fusca TaxID=2419777 RepID=A0A494XF94_9BURK|nr:C80 family cysteine peptidase [Trinickia fusca]RKP46819.1 hypothetical protein D7S89_15755 [Trinickia fusca]